LVTELIADHHAACSVVLPGPGPLAPLLQEAGATVLESSYGWWCETPPGTTHASDLGCLAAGADELVRHLLPLLDAINPDIIVTQTVVIPWGAAAAALLGKPHIWSVCEHGDPAHGLRFPRPMPSVAGEIAASSAFVWTASHNLRNALFPDLGPERCQVLYRAISVPAAGEGAAARPAFHLPGAVRVGLFGTLSEGKGQVDAVRAVARLAERGLDVELLLAGHDDRGYRRGLEGLVAEKQLGSRVRISGFLADPFPAMREADILLACSRSEGFGRTAVEAMLLAKPLVFAAADSYLEFLEDGRTGLSYPPGDDAALAANIARLAADLTLRSSIGAAARQAARSRFSRDAYGGRFFRSASVLAAREFAAAPAPQSLQPLLGAAVAGLSRENAQLHAALDAATVERSRLGQATAARTERVERQLAESRSLLEAGARRLERAERECALGQALLTTVLGSRSWRLTSGLRAAHDFVSRLGRHRARPAGGREGFDN
jgi:glycosyltransferase involved in cell wall biosynthesis